MVLMTLQAGCWETDYGALSGSETAAPDDFRFLGRTARCYLELPSVPRSLLVNCFHIEGQLHIHSNRWAKIPRLRGESWVETVRRNPEVRVQVDDEIYTMRAVVIENEQKRVALLHERGYWRAWNGITVFRFVPAPE